jgi:carboxypeptidase PM20D1
LQRREGSCAQIGGFEGAFHIAQFLKESREEIFFVLDEGGAIFTSGVAGVTKPIALVGIAEKGSVSLTLSVNGSGGHSSMPPVRNVVARLAAALTRLDDRPFPAKLDITDELFDSVQPFAPLWSKIVRGGAVLVSHSRSCWPIGSYSSPF